MAGFVKEVISRSDALSHIAKELSFPWDLGYEEHSLEEAVGRRLYSAPVSDIPQPPYTRSLRDGYAVLSSDVSSASPGSPVFLRTLEPVKMGQIPLVSISNGEAASIPTGGVLPPGADSVVMAEDTSLTGEWLEVRKGVQSSENIVKAGEEIKANEKIMSAGSLIDFRSVSVLAAAGIKKVKTHKLKINILSTGDEIVPYDTELVPPGCVRDANGSAVSALLAAYGFPSEYRKIISDDISVFKNTVEEELKICDVLVLSGGSSVGTRDNCSLVLEGLPSPGLLVRGLNIVPGKPTIVAGCLNEKKLAVSLPGHPLSCLTVVFFFLIPLLLSLIGKIGKTGEKNSDYASRIFAPLASDITAKTGPEEFTPCRIMSDGSVLPVPAKSGYVSALIQADGFILMPENRETARAGEMVEVWLW